MTATAERAQDPWAKWGWLFGGVWLIFFAFPLTLIWTGEIETSSRVLATALIAVFIAVYITTLRVATRLVTEGHYGRAYRVGWTGLVVLIATSVALGVLIGANSMTCWPFVISLPVFFLPWRWVWITSLTLLVGMVVGTAIAWGLWPPAMLWGISLLVLAISVVSRYSEERQEANRETVSRLELTEERERVARDVHDVLGHSLTVVSVKTELAQRLIDIDPERAKAELAEVQSLSRQALAEIRATVGGLRVARLADEVESAGMALAGAGVQAHLPTDLEVVDPRHRITVAWVLREAVTNVVRHSRARTCTVGLGHDWLTVTDDGRGIEGRREGNGLRGLRERVEQAGGTIDVGPGPEGRGTKLEVRL